MRLNKLEKMNIQERTCLICHKKNNKKEFFRLFKKYDESYGYDENQKAQVRGYYICKSHECLKRVAKHKKMKLETEDLIKMLNSLKKVNKDYINILKAMKNSQELSFGMNMVLGDIEHTHFLVIAEDITEKNENKLLVRARELNIKFVYYGNKQRLGEVFGKEEISVIAIKSKKIARGLINDL